MTAFCRAVLFMLSLVAAPLAAAADTSAATAADHARFKPVDVFQLEWASDPQISPDGAQVVYVRNFMDIMTDKVGSNLWIVDTEGGRHRPLTSGTGHVNSPRWSPDGARLVYVSSAGDSTQLYMRWMDTGQTASITNLTQNPGNVVWSPNGRWLALTLKVPEKSEPPAPLPDKPKGAEWAEPVRIIDRLVYRFDGRGFIEPGYTHLFVVPSEGGSPRQLTFGPYNHAGAFGSGSAPSWRADSSALVFAGNRRDGWEYDPLNSELYEVKLANGAIRVLTNRVGPDAGPQVSPDGLLIAYLGFDDRYQGYQVSNLYVMSTNGSDRRVVAESLNRDVIDPHWKVDGSGLFFRYDDQGNGKIGFVTLGGKVTTLAGDVGGTSIGRPYASGSLSVARNDTVAFVTTRPEYPADVALIGPDGKVRRLTRLNEDLLGHKKLARVEEIRFESSHDDLEIQGWIVKPPGFDSKKKYPLILEIHGGPFANYGDRFSAEIQLYAEAGYVVLYLNPRGSTSYGEEFGNLIHHAYPGNDYDDLMSGVDALLKRGYVDEDILFVTGGSGGGVLSAWIVGKTDRFRAAVVAKPVINWMSFALNADISNFVYRYWFPGFPWDYPEEYFERSPLSLAGNVKTPTMLLTGEADHRTPISETEQFYQALKLRKIDTVMVRVPGASHGIYKRPSNLIAKVANILAWFEKYRTDKAGGD